MTTETNNDEEQATARAKADSSPFDFAQDTA
jgi:hypothetical protein